MAEAIFNDLVKGKHLGVSSGTLVIKNGINKEGEKVKDRDMHIVEVMKEIGIDVADNSRSQLIPRHVEEADKIIVMAEHENIPDYLKQSKKAIFWEVSDPKDQSLEFARDVRTHLQTLIKDFIKTLD